MVKTKREKQINFQAELCNMLMTKLHHDCINNSEMNLVNLVNF